MYFEPAVFNQLLFIRRKKEMKKMFLLLALCVATASIAQDQPAGKVHGYVFGDYYYKMGGDKAKAQSNTQYSDPALRKKGAFQLRRMYLYYEHDLSSNFHATFLLEGNDKAMEWAEDTSKAQVPGRHSVFIKLANLEWKDYIKDHSIAIGLIPTATWSLSEKYWGYRAIEKTITDYRGLGGASDIGIVAKGKFLDDGMLGYTLSVVNGNGQKPENNKSRKYIGSLSVKPIKSVITEIYADYEGSITDPKKYNKVDSRNTLKGLVAYQSEMATAGLEVIQQTQKLTDTTDVKPFGFSIFASAPVIKEKLNTFVRYDSYNPNTEITKTGFNEYFFTAGVDYMPIKNVHFMPNIWINGFSAKKGSSRDADVVARLTFFYVYK